MRKIPVLLFIVLISFFQYCASSKKTATTITPPPRSLFTYVTNIQPTIAASCSPCHIPPQGFKRSLNTYDAAKANIDDMIRRIKLNPVERGFMPFKHEKLSDSVINIFVQWKTDGLLEK